MRPASPVGVNWDIVQWRKIRIRRVLLRLLQAVIAVQGATLLALAVVDYRRKQLRKPAAFPRVAAEVGDRRWLGGHRLHLR